MRPRTGTRSAEYNRKEFTAAHAHHQSNLENIGGIIRHALLSIAIPCVVLLAAYALVPRMAQLHPSLAGLGIYGTYVVLALAIIVSLAFRRGRVLLALLTLAIAYAAYERYLQPAVPEHIVFAVFGALCVFVPFNLAALSLLKERGTFNRHGAVRLAVIVLEIALAAWLALPGNSMAREGLYTQFLSQPPWAPSPVPQLGLAAIAMGVIVGGAAWYRSRSAIDLALAGAPAAFGIAAHGVITANTYGMFIAAGALILAIGVLQDTFRMAFRDELTGLPARRALNERLAGLGRHYTIAMLDVDHFKNLNDAHGHDVGDQVLRLVATRLAHARGGGAAYRFGGEEFTLVFPGRSMDEVMPHLEALREEIAGYKMEMRRTDRPGQGKSSKQQRAARNTERPISVTVSVGVAESGGRHVTPDAVVQAADKALYRAKDEGRNRVSR
jgi:GGDEF domain-containing protein